MISNNFSKTDKLLPDGEKFDPVSDCLGLDFDGVIVDSIAECLTVGYDAFQIATGRPGRITDIVQLPAKIQQESRRLRNFIRHGEDFVYIFQIIAEKCLIQNQADFDHFLDNNSNFKDIYRRAFYTERARFLRDQPQGWLKLNPFYEGMLEFLRNYQTSERLYIITTKKLEYVQVILNAGGVAFPPENLFAADAQRSKSEIIRELLEKTGTQPEDFYFIDDQVDTLLKLQKLNIRLFLASWGYANAQQISQAEASGIQPLTLSVFFKLFSHQSGLH